MATDTAEIILAWYAAYHEAAHAVIAFLLGATIYRLVADVRPDGRQGGKCVHSPLPDIGDRQAESIAQILICAAGEAGATCFAPAIAFTGQTPKPVTKESCETDRQRELFLLADEYDDKAGVAAGTIEHVSDLKQIEKLAAGLHPPCPELWSFQARMTANELLNEHRPLLDRLAKELAHKGVLEEVDIADILQEYKQ